jgi:pyruvate formate lyase activating enzyme
MDIKNTLEKYKTTAGLSLDLNNIVKSIELIKNSGTDYEFRTTWMKAFHDLSKVDAIGDMIKGTKRYVFQQYQYSNKQIIDEDFKYFTKEEMAPMIQKLKEHYHVKEVLIRGKF